MPGSWQGDGSSPDQLSRRGRAGVGLAHYPLPCQGCWGSPLIFPKSTWWCSPQPVLWPPGTSHSDLHTQPATAPRFPNSAPSPHPPQPPPPYWLWLQPLLLQGSWPGLQHSEFPSLEISGWQFAQISVLQGSRRRVTGFVQLFLVLGGGATPPRPFLTGAETGRVHSAALSMRFLDCSLTFWRFLASPSPARWLLLAGF